MNSTDVNKMTTFMKINIPVYLHDSAFYDNLDDDEEIVMESKFCLVEPPDRPLDMFEIKSYLDVCAYWGVRKIPIIFLRSLFLVVIDDFKNTVDEAHDIINLVYDIKNLEFKSGNVQSFSKMYKLSEYVIKLSSYFDISDIYECIIIFSSRYEDIDIGHNESYKTIHNYRFKFEPRYLVVKSSYLVVTLAVIQGNIGLLSKFFEEDFRLINEDELPDEEPFDDSQIFYKINGPLIREPSRNSISIMSLAIRNERLDIVKWLHNKGVKWCKNDSGNDLENATYVNNFDIVKYIIENGYNIDYTDYIALYKPIYLGNVEMVKYLVDQQIPYDIHISFLALQSKSKEMINLIHSYYFNHHD